jgi:hypothetical protein
MIKKPVKEVRMETMNASTPVIQVQPRSRASPW